MVCTIKHENCVFCGVMLLFIPRTPFTMEAGVRQDERANLYEKSLWDFVLRALFILYIVMF